MIAARPAKTDAFLSRCRGVVHIGANTAQERRVYAERDLPVWWIEALPQAEDSLRANLSPYPKQRYTIALLTDQNGQEYDFGISNNGGQSSSIFDLADHRLIWPTVGYLGSMRMRSTTFPKLVEREGIDLALYDALVLDTQGSELLVLQGMDELIRQFEWIKTEAADCNLYEGGCRMPDLDEYLNPYGFVQVTRDVGGHHPDVGKVYDVLYRRRKNIISAQGV